MSEHVDARVGVARRSQLARAMLRPVLSRPLLVVFIIAVIVASRVSPAFLSSRNLLNLLQQSSIAGIIAIGMTFVILGAGIDLSVGSVAALSGMVVAILVTAHVPTVLAIILSLGVGAGLGFGMGSLSAFTGVPSFIITLAGLVSLRGVTYLMTDGSPVFGVPDDLRYLGAGFVGGGSGFVSQEGSVPVIGIIFIAVTAAAAIFLRTTRVGRYVYAAGGNRDAARLSGVPVAPVLAFTFLVSGMLSALGGVLQTAWLDVGQPTASTGAELTAIAAVVLGGTSLFGGKGGVFGTFVAVLLLQILSNILNLAGVSPYFQQITTGLVLVVTVLLNWFIAKRGLPMA